MANIIVVGCKLPNGIILEHPLDPAVRVELAGMNRVTIIGAGYATTQVDRSFWDAWEATNKDFPAYVNGSIFVAKSDADLAAAARERAKVKTGFEAMAQNAGGVQPADKA